jgi:hypothetical protein
MAGGKDELTATYVLALETDVFERMGLRPNLSDVIETFDVFYHHHGIGMVRHFGAGMHPRDHATSHVITNFEGNRRTLACP